MKKMQIIQALVLLNVFLTLCYNSVNAAQKTKNDAIASGKKTVKMEVGTEGQAKEDSFFKAVEGSSEVLNAMIKMIDSEMKDHTIPSDTRIVKWEGGKRQGKNNAFLRRATSFLQVVSSALSFLRPVTNSMLKELNVQKHYKDKKAIKMDVGKVPQAEKEVQKHYKDKKAMKMDVGKVPQAEKEDEIAFSGFSGYYKNLKGYYETIMGYYKTTEEISEMKTTEARMKMKTILTIKGTFALIKTIKDTRNMEEKDKMEKIKKIEELENKSFFQGTLDMDLFDINLFKKAMQGVYKLNSIEGLKETNDFFKVTRDCIQKILAIKDEKNKASSIKITELTKNKDKKQTFSAIKSKM